MHIEILFSVSFRHYSPPLILITLLHMSNTYHIPNVTKITSIPPLIRSIEYRELEKYLFIYFTIPFAEYTSPSRFIIFLYQRGLLIRNVYYQIEKTFSDTLCCSSPSFIFHSSLILFDNQNEVLSVYLQINNFDRWIHLHALIYFFLFCKWKWKNARYSLV